MRRETKLLRSILLLTAGMAWAVALPAATASSGTSPKPAAAVSAAVEPASSSSAAKNVASSRPACVSGVSIQEAGGGQETLINVETNHPATYRVFHLNHPARLVLDLEGARNDSHQWKYTSDSPYLSGVRLGRFSKKDEGILRIVADLNGDPAFDVHAAPGGIRIELRSRESAKKAVSPATLTQPDYHNVLPAVAISREVVAAPRPAPVAGDPEASRAAKVMAGSTEAAAPASVPAQQLSSGASNTPQYTGEPISVNLKDVDLKDFFRLIHEISGLNIIVDPNVTGSVTMVLDAVPWDQALDIVLKNNGLGKQLEGNVLRIAKMSTLTAEQEETRKLAEAKQEAEPLVTVFRPISYAKASQIATLLKSWVGGGALSRRGSVLVDDRTNTLIISDIQGRVPLIENVISKLDRKAAQVSIEARIVRVTSDFARNLSTALAFATANHSGSTVAGGATGNNVSGTTLTPPTITTGTAGGFGVFVLSNASSRYSINSAISAAETRDQAKTISRPSVVTQNNVQASVIQGTQIPIQTTINNTISIQYVQASLQLQVTPQVTEDGNVFLTIQVTNASPGPALTIAGPSINTQSATTQVLVPDGGTVVFGGVTVTQRSTAVTQVPLLGSIPILGHLFKNSSTTSNDQELLFFVTPKVLTT